MTTLYISDLDGTLLHDNQQVSPFSASVINRAVERGLLFSLATARSLIGLGMLDLQGIHWNTPLVLMNGVMLYDMASRAILQSCEMPPDAVAAVLAACALYLFTRRTASPLITLSFLAVCALSAILFPRLKDAAWQQSVMMELCSGYLLFAGIFLLNDPVTAPRHWLGRLLYGAFAGILVMALRYFGRFEDAACFAVLLVNAFAPILDRWSWRLLHTLTKGLRPAEEGGC